MIFPRIIPSRVKGLASPSLLRRPAGYFDFKGRHKDDSAKSYTRFQTHLLSVKTARIPRLLRSRTYVLTYAIAKTPQSQPSKNLEN